MNDLMKMADDLGVAIKMSEEFFIYEDKKKAHDDDQQLQAQIGEFNLKKMAIMEEMKKKDTDKDEEKLAELQSQMRDVYSKVMDNPVMLDFLQAKEGFESMVNDIYGIINFHITGEKPNDCGGNCSSCGGCEH